MLWKQDPAPSTNIQSTHAGITCETDLLIHSRHLAGGLNETTCVTIETTPATQLLQLIIISSPVKIQLLALSTCVTWLLEKDSPHSPLKLEEKHCVQDRLRFWDIREEDPSRGRARQCGWSSAVQLCQLKERCADHGCRVAVPRSNQAPRLLPNLWTQTCRASHLTPFFQHEIKWDHLAQLPKRYKELAARAFTMDASLVLAVI